MRRLLLRLAYDGTLFNGWQIQPHGRTVQAEIEKALSEICKQKVTIIGSGRTDSGVHAKKQFAHFDFPLNLSTDILLIALHTKLPPDIRIYEIYEVEDNFNARFDAYERTYHYYLTMDRNPFNRLYKTFIPRKKIIPERMEPALKEFLGTHDFLAFSKPNPDVPNTVCNLQKLTMEVNGNDIKFTITANRFLHNLVRRIIGTLINVSHYNLEPSIIKELFEKGKMNQKYVFTAPPTGLYLVDVKYPEHKLRLEI